MKARLFIVLFIALSLSGFAQKFNISVATATTDFTINIPVGIIVHDVATNDLYLCIIATASGSDLTDAAANFDKIGKAADIHWQSIGGELSPLTATAVGIGTSNPTEALDLASGNLVTTGEITVGEAAASSAVLNVIGGSGGAAIVSLERPGTSTFEWSLSGGFMAFKDVTNGNICLSIGSVEW